MEECKEGDTPVVEARLVCHSYRSNGIRSLDGVSLSIARGEVVGLLGPNGAGKTTFTRILSTLLLPTDGDVYIEGLRMSPSTSKEMRRKIGVTFGGDLGLYLRLTARDNLRYFGAMYGMSGKALDRRIMQLLEGVGLGGRERERVETFSRGMRQRLHIARVLLHRPSLVLLDEPSTGLDPLGAMELRGIIKSQALERRAVLLTTHDLAEAEALCHRVVVLNRGQVVAAATPAELRHNAESTSGTCIRLTMPDPEEQAEVSAWPAVMRVTVEEGEEAVSVYTSDALSVVPALLSRFGIRRTFEVGPPSFNEAVMKLLTGEDRE
jgi:ABC-2 type transport system ATP-binding protein